MGGARSSGSTHCFHLKALLHSYRTPSYLPVVSRFVVKHNTERKQIKDRQKKRRARKHPSTTAYRCSRLIAPQVADCWRCPSGQSPKWGYLDEEEMAQVEGRWPPPSGRCWRTPAGSPHDWRRCHRQQSHCSAAKETRTGLTSQLG